MSNKASNSFTPVITACALFALISFVWSASGFFSPTTSRFGEYTPSGIFQEVAGHVLFGLLVGAFSFDLPLALVCGASSILIDLDHSLSALGFLVLGRTAHSVIFAIVAGLIVAHTTRPSQSRPMMSVTIVGSVLSHLSYDAFAGYGIFPILAPISFSLYSFPAWTWLGLEVSAMTLVLVTALKVRRLPLLRIRAPKSDVTVHMIKGIRWAICLIT